MIVAISESVQTPESLLAPVLVVDTVVGYGWMGIVIALSAFQDRFDRWAKVDRSVVEEINERAGYEVIKRINGRTAKYFK